MGTIHWSTSDQTVVLAKELTARKADWQILAFGHMGHDFTNPMAQSPEQGLFYNATSIKRSWAAMVAFLGEVFHYKYLTYREKRKVDIVLNKIYTTCLFPIYPGCYEIV
ncbi:MAG: dienelactone hydrolase family protein [Flavobacteriaceae bacterium]